MSLHTCRGCLREFDTTKEPYTRLDMVHERLGKKVTLRATYCSTCYGRIHLAMFGLEEPILSKKEFDAAHHLVAAFKVEEKG